jgi:high affinity Mn2+ porin
MRRLSVLVLTTISIHAWADSSAYHEDAPYAFMDLLSEQGLHDLKNETWNAYFQGTYISQWKQGFPAAYTGLNGTPNSLLSSPERDYTGTVTGYFGLRAWQGGEIYLVPEMIAERTPSGLKGVGGEITDFEWQKTGSESATWYKSRFYLQQTFGFGGGQEELVSGPMQLGSMIDKRRLVVTIGNLSVIDIFDQNRFAGNLRQQFFNMAFMTNAAYDFVADARGYSVGMAAEYFHDDWAFRFGHFAAPQHPNQIALDFRMWKYYGQQVEIEHQHELFGQPGAIKVLGYRNYENIGSFQGAINAWQNNPNMNAGNCQGFNYANSNTSAPDLCWSRKNHAKVGIGLNIEQNITENIGVFLRGMYSDGKYEVYSYTSADRSLSLGTQIGGHYWQRKNDTLGIGYAASWISAAHAQFLGLGGIDGFIGDGGIHQGAEQVVDIYYKMQAYQSLWFSADYQHLMNPGYNTDRGPVDVYGVRAHFEF